ncbi:hypothetical protein D3C78_1395500 [compost metagenome]
MSAVELKVKRTSRKLGIATPAGNSWGRFSEALNFKEALSGCRLHAFRICCGKFRFIVSRVGSYLITNASGTTANSEVAYESQRNKMASSDCMTC